MPLLPEFLCQLAHALARPPQRRFRIATRHWTDEPVQIFRQSRVLVDSSLSSRTFPPNSSVGRSHLTRCFPPFQLLHSLSNGSTRHPPRPGHGRDSSLAGSPALGCCDQAAHPFVQKSRKRTEPPLDVLAIHSPQG